MPILLEKVHFLCWRRSLVGALLTPLGTPKFVRLRAHPNTLDETASHPYSISFSSTSRGVLVDMESSSPAGDLSIRALHLTVGQVTSERTAWEGFSSSPDCPPPVANQRTWALDLRLPGFESCSIAYFLCLVFYP